MIRRFLSFVDSFIPKDRAAGIDGAHWWGWFKPELAKKPIDFIVIKATQDDRWVDPAFDENWIGASKIDIRGAYHYQKMFISWRAQADHFLRQAGKYSFHIYALDVEKIGNESAFINQSHGDMFVSDMRRILDYWRQQAPGKSVWLYTNRDIYQTLIYPTVKRLYGAEGLQWLANLPLWLAVYNGLGPHGEPNMPTGRETWQVWQYSDKGRKEDYGTNGAVDLNVYNGTKAEMLLWLGLTDPGNGADEPPPPAPPIGEPMQYKFIPPTEVTNERFGPGTNFGVTGKQYFPGDIVDVVNTPDLTQAEAWGKLINGRYAALKYNNTVRAVLVGTPDPVPTPSLSVLNITVSGDGYNPVTVELKPK